MITDKVLLKNEAHDWENAFPIGNGNLACSVYGNVVHERVQLNQEFIWSENDYKLKKGFCAKLKILREKLINGEDADLWAEENLRGYFNVVGSYETAGELCISHKDEKSNNFTNYSREIDLRNGIVRVFYRLKDYEVTREYFASYPDNVIAVKYKSSKKAKLNLSCTYKRDSVTGKLSIKNNELTFCDKTQCKKHDFKVTIRAFVDDRAKIITNSESIDILQATECVLYIYIECQKEKSRCCPDFTNFNFNDYEGIKQKSIEDFSSLMEKSEITVYGNENENIIETDKLLERVKKTKINNSLISVYFNFAKYLLVSSSRKDTLPANLQGKWNDKVKALWGSDYHTNVNLQMNYWFVDLANISECGYALYNYINEYLLEQGKVTAEKLYNCKGTVVHHLSDIYGFTLPADGLWGLWQLGGAWLCHNLWEHYLFTGDTTFLKKQAFEYIKNCCLFFNDYLFQDGNGILHSGPSCSPENKYLKNGKERYLCLSPAMDIEIIYNLYEIYIKSCEILGVKDELYYQISKAITKLPKLQVGKKGQLQEWQEDYEEVELGHRHISHAFALYPAHQITKDSTPELFDAIKKTIEIRLKNGGGHTGWSIAWLINMYARLQDGKNAAKVLNKLFINSTKPNLYDVHPPFQIDGNFGGASGIIEMLVQSYNGEIRLLPAIDENWNSGEVKGIRIRGGYEIDFKWDNKKVKSISLKSVSGSGDIKIYFNNKIKNIRVEKWETVKVLI